MARFGISATNGLMYWQSLRRLATGCMLVLITCSVLQADTIGPVWVGDIPGGASADITGGVAVTGGREIELNFDDPSQFVNLYFGVSSNSPPASGLNNTPDAMTFSGVTGTVATWVGTTQWVNDQTGVLVDPVATRYTIDIAGSTGLSWTTDLAAAGLPSILVL